MVSLGALDMVNFGPMATVPSRFQGRKLHAHNPSVTLMRTTPEENESFGLYLAEVLGRAQGPVVLLIPGRGLSALDAPGQPFLRSRRRSRVVLDSNPETCRTPPRPRGVARRASQRSILRDGCARVR